ncbi:hypothetical protein SteCoe_4069 [Stentor coeruleus]|uniref:Formyl transferase N-terminal domain-containing protein n=1 Tax=Stentor coeruleus TaxID=5963 RepID=A0A1R2CVJ1_9CILI|nr:hypothetical protein SteCoe_4069 [Stentor coeruleus]
MAKRLLFLGSDGISKICLEKLLNSYPAFNYEIITTSSKSPPAKLAQESKLLCHIESKGQMKDWKLLQPNSPIWSTSYDYIVSASFGYLIPGSLISHCKSSLNMHPSLLPKYRGSSPIQYAIYNNDEKTGVSIITLHPEKFDKGKILIQKSLDENINTLTYSKLSTKLAVLGGELLTEVLKDYDNYYTKGLEQIIGNEPLAYKLNSDFAKLDSQNTDELYRRFRSISGTSLNPYFMLNGETRVNILGMRLVRNDEDMLLKEKYPNAVPGSLWLLYPGINKQINKNSFIKSIEKLLYLKTGDGWIVVDDFIPATKTHDNKMFGDFVNSYFDLEKYMIKKNMTKMTGEDLKFV